MKPPPRSLPAANSRKWHSRRVWDSLGYFRMRTLANPQWKRDPKRVISMLRFDGATTLGRRRDLIDKAIALAGDFAKLAALPGESADEFAARQEQCWDAMLTAIDGFLELRQAEHLRAVDEAGASGRR